MSNNNMITVNTINYYALQNDEFLGMQQKFVTFTPGLTNEVLKDSVTAYKNSVQTLTDHLALSASETIKHTAMRLNRERSEAYKALRDSVKLLTMSEDAASATLGKTLYSYFDGYESLHNFNQDAATKIINAVIVAFRSYSTEELTDSAVERWLALLEKKQAAFEVASKARGEESDSHIDRLTLQYRRECVQNFELLTDHVRILAIRSNDAACESFIAQVNGEIALRKEKLKVRKNAAAKKNEGSDSNGSKTETAADTAKTDASTETTKVETVTESTNTETIKAVA